MLKSNLLYFIKQKYKKTKRKDQTEDDKKNLSLFFFLLLSDCFYNKLNLLTFFLFAIHFVND